MEITGERSCAYESVGYCFCGSDVLIVYSHGVCACNRAPQCLHDGTRHCNRAYRAGDTIERITPDTVSLIACKGAESEARVAGGVLYHRLVLQERHDSVRVEVREQLVIDSVPYPVYVDGASQRPVSVWIWRVVAIAAIVVAGVCLLCGMRR